MTATHHHPLFARIYTRLSKGMEEHGVAALRDELLAGLRGRVLEIGCGNGMNFRHYPDGVDEVVALEPEPFLRRRAEEAAARAPVPIQVLDGVAEHIPARDDTFDAVVASLMLCSVDDQATVLREIERVLADGGELRFFEHVRAASPGLARVQRVMDATFWPRVGGGCHASRDTLRAIESSTLDVMEVRRFRFPETRVPVPTAPHILGRARASS